jgi:hypothetical protein
LFRPLVLYTLRLSIALAVFAGAAILTGIVQPPSDWVTLLHLNDCELPCWIGIVPGKTTFAEAQRQIEAVYRNNSAYGFKEYGYNGFGVINVQTSQSLIIRLASDVENISPDVVQRIYLQPYYEQGEFFVQPLLGELWNNLGNPQAVSLLIGGGGTVIFVLYREERIVVATDNPARCNKVSPYQKAGYFLLQGQPRDQHHDDGFSTAPLAWQGFNKCHDF